MKPNDSQSKGSKVIFPSNFKQPLMN